MSLQKELTTTYNKRFNRIKKKKFRRYIKKEFEGLGYDVYEHKGIMANNLYIGNIEASKVIMAHYDTPPNMALFLIFNNMFGTKLGQIFIAIALIASLYLVGWFLPSLYGIYNILLLLYIVSMFLIGNKNNFNDNTSGVLTALLFLEKLEVEKRDEFLVVLTDNEEKGLFGAYKFRKFMKKKKLYDKDIVVVDCVGEGEEYAVISLGKNRRADKFFNVNKSMYSMKRYTSKVLVSDNGMLGKNAFLISKMSKSKFFNKPTIRNMHTNKDSNLEINNINEVHSMIQNYFSDINYIDE